eukprot:SAG31_NODE_1810_length_7224_cov_1.969965_4_plen_281_part_00
MLSQIARTDRWLDDACRPIMQAILVFRGAMRAYLNGAVFALQTEQPDVVAAMLASSSKMFPMSEGTVRSNRTGRILWEPAVATSRGLIVKTFDDTNYNLCAASYSVYAAFVHTASSQPFCEETPAAMVESIIADPHSLLAQNYRRFCRTTLVPATKRVAKILQDHASVVEWPSIEWLSEKYPKVSASNWTNDMFALQWIAYSVSWDHVLHSWDAAEDFTIARPGSALPLGGLMQSIAMSTQSGTSKQRDLIVSSCLTPRNSTRATRCNALLNFPHIRHRA